MLSCIPTSHETLRATNDYGAALVSAHPDRFGLLAALPTDDPTACLVEIERTVSSYAIPPDGFALSTCYNNQPLADPRLDPVWAALDVRGAVVHIHLTTTIAPAGGALPALAGRLELLGAESWVDNPQGVTREEITRQLGGLHVDTAASARTGIPAAAVMCGPEKCVYGSDCGVPCSTEETMRTNQADLAVIERRLGLKENSFGRHGWKLFPNASKRAGIAWATE